MDAASPFLIDLFLGPFSTSATLGAVATAASVWSYGASVTLARVAGRSWKTKYQSAFGQCLRHIRGITAVLWNWGEPAPSLLLFNQSSAGWVKINDLWVLALTGAYSSQSRAPLPPNVTFNEPISPQWRGRHLKLLFTLHSLLISHS